MITSITFDAQWKKMIQDMKKSVRGGDNYRQEFVDLLAVGLLNYIKDLSPVLTGTLRDSWKIFDKSLSHIIIGTDNPEAYRRVIEGITGRTITSNRDGGYLEFPGLDGQLIQRKSVTIKSVEGHDFLKSLLDKAVDKAILDLSQSLVLKHIPITRMGEAAPNITQLNLSKTVGLTGTKRNTRRGRGGGVQKAKTGRKSFKRTLSRRRRTGKFITRKDVKVE